MAEFRYPAVGRCIYCGFSDGQLSDEHIIPFALGGKYVLPKASCHQCAKITSKFERACLRGTLLPLRMLFGLQTRRPALRPTKLPVEFEMPNGERRRILIPIAEYPPVISLIAPEPAKILRDLPPRKDGKYNVNLWTHMPPLPELNGLREKYGAGAKRCFFYTFQWHMIKWSKMFAKIGYAWAKANNVNISEAFASEFILGDFQDQNYFVGAQLNFDMSSVVGDDFFQLSTEIYTINGLVVAAMRFVPKLDGPVYHVVIGRHRNQIFSASQDGSD